MTGGIVREPGAPSPFVRLGRQPVLIGSSSFNDGAIPGWLRRARDASDAELANGTVAASPLTATALGALAITNGATGVDGIETQAAFDLRTGIFQTLEFTLHNVTIDRASAGAHAAIEMGFRDAAGTAGARFQTTFAGAGDTDADKWPVVAALVAGAPSNPQAVHSAWGSRVTTGADARLLGDSARSYTFRLDIPDPDYHPVSAPNLSPPRVSILMGDGELFSEERPDMVLGVVRARFTVARVGSVTGDRTVKVRGIECWGWTNSDFTLP